MDGISTGTAFRPAVRNNVVAPTSGSSADGKAVSSLYSSLHPTKAGKPTSPEPPKQVAGAGRSAPQAAPRPAGTSDVSVRKTVASTADHWGADLTGLAQDSALALGHAAKVVADSATGAVQKAGSTVGSAVDAVGSGAKQAASYVAHGWNTARAVVDEVT